MMDRTDAQKRFGLITIRGNVNDIDNNNWRKKTLHLCHDCVTNIMFDIKLSKLKNKLKGE